MSLLATQLESVLKRQPQLKRAKRMLKLTDPYAPQNFLDLSTAFGLFCLPKDKA